MQKDVNGFLQNKFYWELIVAVILFGVAALTNTIVEFIIYMLYFIIFLEIVRAVSNFIREQTIKITLLIDAFIILTLREFIVNVVKVNKEDYTSFTMLFSSPINFHLMIFSVVLIFLFLLRYVADVKLYGEKDLKNQTLSPSPTKDS